MGYIALFTCLLGYVHFSHLRFKIPYNFAVPVITSIIVSIIFLAALTRKLEVVTYSIYLLGTLLLIFNFIMVFFKKYSLKSLFPSELVFLITICLLYYLRVFHAYFVSWDDFSLWGILSKEIYLYNGITQMHQDSSVLPSFVSYTRLPALFNYFVTKAAGFTEGNNLFAAGLLSILLTSVLLVPKAAWHNSFVYLGILAATTLYTQALRSLYIDGMAGVAFGCVLAIYVLEENKFRSLLYITPILFILPNLKEVGFWFAYAALITIAISLLASKKLKENKSTFITLLLLFLIPYLSYKLWAFYLSSFQSLSVKPKLSLLEFLKKFIPITNTTHDREVIAGVVKGILKFLIKEGTIVVYLLMSISIYALRKYGQEFRKDYKIMFFTLLSCFIIYLGFRFSLYFTHISLQEAQKGGSYVRYYGSFTLAFAFLFGSYTILALTRTTEEKPIESYIKLSLGIMFFSIISFCIFKRPSITLSPERIMVKQVAQQLIKLKTQGLKVYTIYNNFNALNCYQLNYELVPNGLNEFNKCNMQTSALWPDSLSINQIHLKEIDIKSFNHLKHLKSNSKNYDLLYIPNNTNLKAINSTTNLLAVVGNKFVPYQSQ